MSERSARRRIATATAVLAGLATVTLPAVSAAAATSPGSSSGQSDPVVAFFQSHPGVMPTAPEQAHIKAWKKAHPQASTTAAATTVDANTLAYQGGSNGEGVMSGAKTKVYVVFYGTQWGTQSTDAKGDAKFTGDPDGAASAAQEMFKGIGTNSELWSADLTQWCDGSTVSAGAYSCPTTTPASAFVPYQSGGVLAGAWYDNSAASPSTATEHQLAQEAINAAAHFGNTTAASNRNAYYVILSPHGTDPDNYQSLTSGYCAWHMWTGYPGMTGGPLNSPYGPIAFSNQPYNMDFYSGTQSACGVGFVNGASGTLDGYTMTIGHEWHEMMSDTLITGWNNPGTNGGTNGYENSDECAWIAPGSAGGAANIAFATGTFAEQASWSNDTDNCAISHPIVNHGGQGDTVTVSNPGSQSGTVGTAASLQISATDSASGQTLTYSASGLPAGLSINSATGLISGTPTTAGTSNVTVTATDTTKASGSASFTWTVATSGTGCAAANLIVNGGFENGTTPWTGTTGSILQSSPYGLQAHSGSYVSWLDGYGFPATDTIAQSVGIPSTCKSASFSFWHYISTGELALGAADTLSVQVLNSSGAVLATLHSYSNLDADNKWDQATFSLSQFIGQHVTLKFTGTETDAYYGTTNFVLDDAALNVS